MKEALLTTATEIGFYSPDEVFFCPEESLFYSQCLEKMVFDRCTPFDTIIEFGTGDGSPVIHAILKTNFLGTVHGYELNPSACQVARDRVEKYRIKNRYTIQNQCFYSNYQKNAKYLIANPPYLPAPDNKLYMPELHGGEDGATITKSLLSMDIENVMLMISAYSNPIETIEHARNNGYAVIDFSISPLPFGYYSREPKVKKTINALRSQGKAFFSPNIYFLAGALFKKKSPEDVDLAAEFLKVMTVL